MSVIRTQGEINVSFFDNKHLGHQFENKNEWINEQSELGLGELECRIDIKAWIERYEYESKIITPIIKNHNLKKIIELGSGPGSLGQIIIKDNEVDYTFIDQPGAFEIFKNRNYKGKFLIKDLMNDFDISDIDKDYDFLITNDFLEHIYNPSLVVQKCYKVLRDGGMMFVSVPNWRMGHTFIYRGLFDYDNFLYFMYTHGFEAEGVYNSPLKCPESPKLSSESEMDEILITSWNWYFLFKKRM